ncbi:TetR/AcrR family transcriptional regulator [Nocardia sp. SC052]|uniref:TetR/AcrR family transcriptional regulator n=1 Tax=Nocardia sichangensis TaxID=3385975 RepID=UPI0039A041CD
MATRRAETTQESKQLLVAAAAELFAERGYRQTTFADIADRSGISRGSITWHFGSKEGLLEAVIKQMVSSVEVDLESPGVRGAGLDRVLQGAVEMSQAPGTKLFITMIAEATEPGSPLRARYAELHEVLRRRIHSWVDSAMLPAGVTLDGFAAVVLGSVIGIHQQWRIAPESFDLEDAYASLRQLMRCALKDAARLGG